MRNPPEHLIKNLWAAVQTDFPLSHRLEELGTGFIGAKGPCPVTTGLLAAVGEDMQREVAPRLLAFWQHFHAAGGAARTALSVRSMETYLCIGTQLPLTSWYTRAC